MELDDVVSGNLRRSRSKTPNTQTISANTTRERALRKRQGSATSTLNEADNVSSNLPTIRENTPSQDSEPVAAPVNDNGIEKSRNRRSARPKSNLITNGSMKKSETVTTTVTTNSSTTNASSKKAGAAKENRARERTKTSDYSSDEEDRFTVYKTYKEAGDWWDKYPKTDYTYSPLSNSRFEVAPGVYNKPNMSRPGLRQDYQHDATYMREETYATHSVQTTTPRAPTRATTRSTFFAERPARHSQHREDQIDSDSDGADEYIRTRATVQSAATTSHIAWFFIATWSLITTTWSKVVETTYTTLGWEYVPAGARTPRRQPTGVSWWMRMLYYPAVWAKAVDTWILSRFHTGTGDLRPANSKKNVRYLIALLLLLLLLLLGWWFFDQASTFVAKSVSTLAAYFIPMAVKAEREGFQVTEAKVEPVTIHHIPSTPPTISPPVIDMPALMSIASERDIDIDGLITRILATGRLQDLMKANKVDVEAVTLAVLASVQMRQFLAERKEHDMASLVARILVSDELNLWLSDNKQHLDVESVTAKVLASARLDTWLKDWEQQNTAAQLAISAEWSRAQAEMRLELQEKDRMLSEQNRALHELTARLERLDASVHRDRGDGWLRREMREKDRQMRLLQERQYAMFRKCCSGTDMEAAMARMFAAQFGMDSTQPDAMKQWAASLFVARDDLEARLANITRENKQNVEEAWNHSAASMMASISDRISEEIVLQRQTSTSLNLDFDTSTGLSTDQVRAIVTEVLTIYDADKTGKVDHALESSGGEILSTRCTETHHSNSASFMLFGIPLWYRSNNPRSVIQPGMHPGECWAFRGSQGFLVIKLAGLVRVSSFSMEHIPRLLAFGGNIDSAPKDFTVLGLDSLNDAEPVHLGRFTYQQNSTSLQHFIVPQPDTRPFNILELRIESNHGNMEYTCLYRFRVHGTWISH